MHHPTLQSPVTRVMLGRYTPEPGALSQHPEGWLTCRFMGIAIREIQEALAAGDLGRAERKRVLLAECAGGCSCLMDDGRHDEGCAYGVAEQEMAFRREIAAADERSRRAWQDDVWSNKMARLEQESPD